MSVFAAFLFAVACVLFVIDGLEWTERSLATLGLAVLTAGLFVALTDGSNAVHF